MFVVFLVAVEAAAGCASEFDFWGVTAVASHLLVTACELEVREGVVERLLIELNDVGCPPLMVGVAAVAIRFQSVGPLTVQASPNLAVAGDVLMAG
jgi:hypothetical protein